MKKDKNGKEYEFKNCVTCKRPFQNRKSWARRNMWEKIIYCSSACSKFKKSIKYK